MTSTSQPPEPAATPSPPTAAARRVRWWPALVILALALLVYAALWFIPHLSQQHFNLHVAQVVIGTSLLLVLWLLLFSRLRWQRRLLCLGVIVLSLAAVAALFRIRGVTGNLVPILEPRWARREFQQLSSSAGAKATLAARSDAALATAIPGAADFPQFLGPTRDTKLPGPRLATNWTVQPPALLWRQPVGAAWSGFAVAGSVAVTQEQRGEDECVVAYHLTTGRLLWSHTARTRYFTTLAGEGPRATPTLARGRVFTQGATGILSCLELETGQLRWSLNIFTNNQTRMPGWGQACSPLVLGDWVIVAPGGHHDRSLVAYRVDDGSFVWGAGKEGDTYSSPMPVTLGGVRQIVLFADRLVGHDAATGKPLWKHPWPGGHPHICMPVVASDSELIVSSGYGTGSARVRVERDAEGNWQAKQLWRSNRMKAKFTNLVLHRGFLYGLDDGIMACLDAANGEFKWKDGKYGHGQVLLVDELLLVMAEDGTVVLVDPSPDGLHELTRFTALHDKTWNPPALAGEYFLARNDKEAVCFRLPVRTP
jgi:outer membrane protein assembly factor BamB